MIAIGPGRRRTVLEVILFAGVVRMLRQVSSSLALVTATELRFELLVRSDAIGRPNARTVNSTRFATTFSQGGITLTAMAAGWGRVFALFKTPPNSGEVRGLNSSTLYEA